MRAVKLTDDQFKALTTYLDTIIQQHTALVQQVNNVWLALVLFAVVGLVSLACMFFLAAWSVRVVNHRQALMEQQMLDITAKFNLLIDILLEDARRRNVGSG